MSAAPGLGHLLLARGPGMGILRRASGDFNAGGGSPDVGRWASCAKGFTVGVPRTLYLGLGLDLTLPRRLLALPSNLPPSR